MSFICVTTIGSSSWGYLHHSYYRRVNNNLIRYGCYTRFILINKESQRIEKYLYEEEQKQQDL